MSRFESHYSPGGWVAVSAESGWLLVDLPLADDRLAAVWRELSGQASPDGVLDLLLRDGLQALPAFALAVVSPDQVRVVVRGGVIVTIDDEIVDATSASWTDRTFHAEVSTIRITAADKATSSITLPMSGGISEAGQVELRQPATADAPATQAAPAPRAVAPDLRTESDPRPEPHPPLAEDLVHEADQTNTDQTDADQPRGADYRDLFLGTGPRKALLDHLTELEDRANRAMGAPAEDEAEPTSDDPVDKSVAAAPDGLVSPLTATWAGLPDPHDADPVESQQSSPAPPIPPTPRGVIDRLPWDEDDGIGASAGPSYLPPRPALPAAPVAMSTPAPARPVSSVQPPPPNSAASASTQAAPGSDEPDPEREVRTQSRAELLAALQESEAHLVGPTVIAVQCAAGHPTPADHESCRVCGRTVDLSAPRVVPRPALGVLILSTGEAVTLDRDVIVGRAPEASETNPAERPNRVKVADPMISRNHVLISLHGWEVRVRDLDSSNGTELVHPGVAPVELLAHEDRPLLPGDRVVLGGDVITLVYEVTA